MRYTHLCLVGLLLAGITCSNAQSVYKIDSIVKLHAKEMNVSQQYATDDLSKLWNAVPDGVTLGFIGENYSRFRIKFLSVTKDPKDYYGYNVTGKTKRWDTVYAFSGTIHVSKMWNPVKVDEGQKPGVLIGSYKFTETKSGVAIGTLQGKLVMDWYNDDKDEAAYNTLMIPDEIEFSNNKFVGIWMRNGSDKPLICNWGDNLIPDSGDLDEGTSDFIPANKYSKFGWKTYNGIDDNAKDKWWK